MTRPRGFKHHGKGDDDDDDGKRKKNADAMESDFGDYYDYDENVMDRIEDAMADDEDDFEDELPFMVPLIQATSNLLPNVLRNAKQVLPKVLKTQVDNGGIERKLKRRGGPEMYGTLPRQLRRRRGGRRKMMDRYGYYVNEDSVEDRYYEDYEEDEGDGSGYSGYIMDDWYDEETASDWVVMMDRLDDDMMMNLVDDTMDWSMVTEGIMTNNGEDVTRKCTNLFGHQICICQFLEMIKVKTNQHLCYPKTSKSKPLKSTTTKNVMTKIGIIGNTLKKTNPKITKKVTPKRPIEENLDFHPKLHHEMHRKEMQHLEQKLANKLNDRKMKAIERKELR